jgi:hypothetical protein
MRGGLQENASRGISAAKNAVRGAVARRAVRGRQSDADNAISDVITRVMSSLGYNDVVVFSEWLEKFPSKVTRVRPPKKIVRYEDLWPKYYAPPIIEKLSHNLLFITVYLESHSNEINTYVNSLAEIEDAWLRGNYEQALRTLDDLEAQLGMSVWAIEARISLLQRCKGLEEQKAFSRSIHEQFPGSLAAFIAHYTSERNEEGLSYERFSKKIQSIAAFRKPVTPVIKYVQKQLMGVRATQLDETDVSNILSVSAALSLVDAYEGFIFACQTGVTMGLAPCISLAVQRALGRLSVQDWRLDKLRSYFCNSFGTLEIRNAAPEESLILGNYEISLHEAIGNVVQDPGDIDSVVTAATACVMSGGMEIESGSTFPLQSELLPLLISVRAKTGSVARSASELLRLTLNTRSLRISGAIYGYLLTEWDERPQIGECEATSIFLCTRTLNPLHWLLLPSQVAEQLLSHVSMSPKGRLPCALSSSLFFGTGRNIDAPSGALTLESSALGSLYRNDVSEALETARRLSTAGTYLASLLAAKIELHCLLEQGQTTEAIRQIAKYCCEQDDFRHILPLRALLTGERWRNLRHLRSEISLPIVFDLYWRTVDDSEHETNRRIAYDEFLKAHDCRRPSDLRKIASEFPQSLLIYFLSQICVRNVMDVSFDVFATSREIEEERIRICSWLGEIDQANSSIYGDEIKDITKYLSIQDGLRDVDASRVYVNSEAIVRWAEKELQENFWRYKSLLRAGIGFGSPEEFERAVRSLIENADTTVAEEFAQYPDNEADNLLIEIFEALKNEYLTHPDYGLDVYLSMRIRHGSLSGHLRGPLEEHSLIVSMDEAEKEYCENVFWLQRLVISDVDERKCLIKSFKDFSRSYDDIINDLATNRLQIRKPEKPAGVFCLSLDENPLIIHYIRNQVQESTTFTEFLQLLFEGINFLLQPILLKTRDYIGITVKHQVESAFEALRSALDACMDPGRYAVVNSAIAGMIPQVQAAIDRVAEWFAPTDRQRVAPLRGVDQIVDIGIAATKHARRGFDPKIHLEIENIEVHSHRLFSEFMDILFTILDNVHAHSGNKISPWINIVIQTKPIDGSTRRGILVRVESEIAEGQYNSFAVAKLDRIRRLMESGEYRTRANLEGGSGLLKLKRLVSVGSAQTLQFGFLKESAFFVELNLRPVVVTASEGLRIGFS